MVACFRMEEAKSISSDTVTLGARRKGPEVDGRLVFPHKVPGFINGNKLGLSNIAKGRKKKEINNCH